MMLINAHTRQKVREYENNSIYIPCNKEANRMNEFCPPKDIKEFGDYGRIVKSIVTCCYCGNKFDIRNDNNLIFTTKFSEVTFSEGEVGRSRSDLCRCPKCNNDVMYDGLTAVTGCPRD